jgi:exosortase/archaeosortase family protein
MSRGWLESRAVALLALLIAGWPVARWYAVRLNDGSDEPWGIAALAAALVFAPREGWREALPAPRWIALGAITSLYGLAQFLEAPSLVLALPIIATLQFYLGYPLRLATAVLSTGLLKLGGLTVQASGTTLLWAGERVVVDAPCSGIHMLWTGLFIAAVLACWQQLDWRGTLRLLQRASLVVFAANVIRATALFCLETGLWPTTPWAHEGAGLVLFAAAAGTIYFLSGKKAVIHA